MSLAASANPLWALLALLGLLAAGAMAAAAMHRRSLAFVYPLCILVAGSACVVDLSALLAAGEWGLRLPLGLPSIGVRLRLVGRRPVLLPG